MLDRMTSLALLLVLIVAVLSGAQETLAKEESNWRLGAAIGYGERSNPLIQSEDVPIVIDLDIAWFGARWFFDNGDVGFTVANNEAVTASLVARVNSDRVFFGKTDTRFVNVDLAGAPLAEATDFKPPERDYAVELGLELLTDGDWGAMQMSAFHDVSGTHEGFEIYANYSYGWRKQHLYVEPSFGASFKSADLNNYYWGVTPDEAGLVAFPYEANAGLNWHARLAFSYQLNREWAVSVVAEYDRLNDEAAASPIVEEANVLGWFAGFSRRF